MRIIRIALVAVLVVNVAFVGFLFWLLFVPHHLATLPLGSHKVRITVEYNWDVSHNVRCELRGPKYRHRAEIVAFIGADQSNPAFTIHQSTNHQIFWVTTKNSPKTILYAVNLNSGAHWSGVESREGRKNFWRLPILKLGAISSTVTSGLE
jgi:hypothetical protein